MTKARRVLELKGRCAIKRERGHFSDSVAVIGGDDHAHALRRLREQYPDVKWQAVTLSLDPTPCLFLHENRSMPMRESSQHFSQNEL